MTPIRCGEIANCCMIRSSPALVMLARLKWLMKQSAIRKARIIHRWVAAADRPLVGIWLARVLIAVMLPGPPQKINGRRLNLDVETESPARGRPVRFKRSGHTRIIHVHSQGVNPKRPPAPRANRTSRQSDSRFGAFHQVAHMLFFGHGPQPRKDGARGEASAELAVEAA